MNHFCDRVSDLLVQQGIPVSYRDQAKMLAGNPIGAKLLQIVQTSQMSLIMFSNPLFTEGVKKFPLKIKKALDPNEE